MINKRKVILANLLSLIMALCLLGGCNDALPPNNQIGVHTEFCVCFINVGQGDCIFIKLPDGKSALIDCGINQGLNLETIQNYLSAYSVDKIDYFVLTHPDLDHIGNAYSLISEYSVGEMFVPYVHTKQLCNFKEFADILDLAQDKLISIKEFDQHTYIQGQDYVFAFLSPLPLGVEESSYNNILEESVLTESAINNLSPIIYFECLNKRFIFTGDAGYSQEDIVVQTYNNGAYEQFFGKKGINVNLDNIDCLKISHHGSADATGEQFLTLLQPKNAIISVAGQNFYGHPASQTLERLISICPDCRLYRTDRDGTICFYKDKDGNLAIDKAS